MGTSSEFGRRLRDTRIRQGLTQERLAEITERSVEALSNIERGVSLPNVETLQRLSQAFGISVSVLNEWLIPLEIDDVDPERDRLEATLAQLGRTLGLPALRLAVEQLQAITKHERALTLTNGVRKIRRKR